MILGCSADSVERQAKFKEKYNLNFALLSDPNFETIEAYGAHRMKSFLGKTFLGIVRMSYWIDPEGKICRVWNKASSKGHPAQILEEIARQ